MDKTSFLGVTAGMVLLSILFFPVGEKFVYYLLITGLILGISWFTRI